MDNLVYLIVGVNILALGAFLTWTLIIWPLLDIRDDMLWRAELAAKQDARHAAERKAYIAALAANYKWESN